MDQIKQIINEENTAQTIKNICSFSKDTQLLFYEIAVYFHEQAFYEKAINAFTFLTMMNPRVQSFWIGLALAYEKNLNFDKAIQSFESAIKSDPSDFTPYYGLIRCYEQSKDYKKIDELLEGAKNNDAIKDQVAEVIEYLKAKK
jgi:tetratricopeptide (TPR) repeat protein